MAAAAAARPTGLIATKGIELLTWGTPNGFKASILLEELKESYGLQYTFQGIPIGQNVQKEPWFTAVNPNGRIPAIVDHDNGGLAVFETNAILGYLTRRYDPENRFSFAVEDDDYTRAESWIGWQHGGLGPMAGQANVFLNAKEKIPFAIQRYVGETERLCGVLDARLSGGREYLVGPGPGRYSIADIACIGWLNSAQKFLPDVDAAFPGLAAWLRRCWARPAVKRGFNVPNEAASWPFRELSGEEEKRQREERMELIRKAKEQYGYVYKSP